MGREPVKGEQKKVKVIAKEGTISVTRTILSKEDTQNNKIKIRPFATATASVSVKFGVTIPTQAYGSARVDVMITIPCYVEEVSDIYPKVRDLVDHLVDQEAGRLTGGK
jgi:3-polyprenyl-4-hydroxybenzoate decarboxylase